jgi:hypothetical protein
MEEEIITIDENNDNDISHLDSPNKSNNFIEVKSKIGSHVVQIDYIVLATREQGKIVKAESINLTHGRGYFIPVNVECDSDDYPNMKIFSDMSSKIDIKFVKNKKAFVIPVQHNVKITDNELLCVLWK